MRDPFKEYKETLREDELRYMRAALDEAEKGVGHTRPNPPVGAVIVKAGRIIGRGYHARCGEDHAEVAALKSCIATPKDATAYVTLEPCSTAGRVGACTDALMSAGIKRVEWLVADPNPKNHNLAARNFKFYGIRTRYWASRMYSGYRGLYERGYNLIRPFAKVIKTGLPFVTVKLAMSMDGKICDNLGNAKWISDEEARKATLNMRDKVDCVLVGAETIRRDNPSLLLHTDINHQDENPDLYRAVITRSGNLPKNAQIFTDIAKERTIVLNISDTFTLRDALKSLAARGLQNILCEGGLNLARSLAAAGLVDRWMTVLCPIVIGDKPLDQALRYTELDELEQESIRSTDEILVADTFKEF